MGACIFKCGSQKTAILRWRIRESVYLLKHRNIYLRDSDGWTSPIQEKLAEQDLVWQSQEVQWLCNRGAIKVFSQPSEGTTFTVRIPLNYVS